MDFERWINLIAPFDEPTSRLYYTNLFSAFIIVILWILFTFLTKFWFSKKPLFYFIKILRLVCFNKSYWWNSSTRTDYYLFLLNGLLKSVFFLPLVSITFFIAQKTLQLLRFIFTQEINFSLSYEYMILFSFLVFVFDDALRFYHHWLMHRVPWFWSFHKVHHNATTLTPITLFRTHPIESLIGTIRNGVTLGVASGAFVFLFNSPLTVWTIMGVNGFGYFFNLLAANLRHSQIPLGFGFLEHFIISPKQHQMHHANQKHFQGKNLGVNLACWDKIHRTHLLSSIKYKTKMTFGNLT